MDPWNWPCGLNGTDMREFSGKEVWCLQPNNPVMLIQHREVISWCLFVRRCFKQESWQIVLLALFCCFKWKCTSIKIQQCLAMIRSCYVASFWRPRSRSKKANLFYFFNSWFSIEKGICGMLIGDRGLGELLQNIIICMGRETALLTVLANQAWCCLLFSTDIDFGSCHLYAINMFFRKVMKWVFTIRSIFS